MTKKGGQTTVHLTYPEGTEYSFSEPFPPYWMQHKCSFHCRHAEVWQFAVWFPLTKCEPREGQNSLQVEIKREKERKK